MTEPPATEPDRRIDAASLGAAAHGKTGEDEERNGRGRLLGLSIGALGVVYGDIGTSPLYAFRQALKVTQPDAAGVLGILSLIFWSLTIVVTLKYLMLVMRADNRGEGGILALLALLNPWRAENGFKRVAIVALGLFGAALLYGDGMITPAISVLSAVEGLKGVDPGIEPYIVPITVAILVLLFWFQKHGTGSVGAIFGPITAVWFLVLAGLGLSHIWQHPEVLLALNPLYAVELVAHGGTGALLVLGAVFLVVTGSEALYADMGHFGRGPIRLAWFAFVLPCLVLNYFGQGALVLSNPAYAVHPFFDLAPGWMLLPLIALATAATVIASQAVISGSFSLTRQAIQLGYAPRMIVVQTSSEEAGQIYVPTINAMLAVATIGLVFSFRSSSALAAAYGVAISTTMVITTLLTFYAMRDRWRWSLAVALSVAGFLLIPDIAFLSANALKIVEGGWFPLLVGALAFLLLATWHRGRELLLARLNASTEPIGTFLARVVTEEPMRVPGTAVFLTARANGTPPILPHHLEHNQVLHEQVILLTVVTEDVPRVGASERITVEELGRGFWRVLIHYGFMQTPNIPVALRFAQDFGFKIDLDHLTYYVGRESLIPTVRVPGMALWRERLFAFMARNAAGATAFYHLPHDKVVELGMQVEI
jgi:KUP system potassium uptake protein